MLDIIYYFNIFGCLTMGMALLLIQTAPQLINPHYRNAKRFLGIASIIVALCNALILYNRVQESVAEIFAMPVLVADGKYPDRFLLRIHSSGKKEQYAHTNHYNLILLHHIQI